MLKAKEQNFQQFSISFSHLSDVIPFIPHSQASMMPEAAPAPPHTSVLLTPKTVLLTPRQLCLSGALTLKINNMSSLASSLCFPCPSQLGLPICLPFLQTH